MANDTNGVQDVFVRDRLTGQTSRASVSSAGTQGNGVSSDGSPLAISADGRHVVFSSAASNLVSGDTNGTWDVFVRDRQAGQTTRISTTSSGQQGNNESSWVSMSPDARYVAFSSYASNLVPNDTNATADVFVHDRQLGETTRVSLSSSGQPGNSHSVYGTSISSDGRFIAFGSYANNLVPGDTNGRADIFVRDRQTGRTLRASVSSAGQQGNNTGNSYYVSINADGRYVAFLSDASNLVLNDTNGDTDVFAHDVQTGQTSRISVSASGQEGNEDSESDVSISADGRYVGFTSNATNLVLDDTNDRRDTFVRDRITNQTSRVSISSSGTQGNSESHYSVAISADGRFAAFDSFANNLVLNDTNANQDIFVHQYGPSWTEAISYVTTAGYRVEGSIGSFFASDDSCLRIFPEERTSIAQVHIEGTSPLASPNSIAFKFEGSATMAGLSQTIRFRNFVDSSFTLVDGRVAQFVDTTIEVTLTTNVADHVGPNGLLVAEVTWQLINDEDPAQDGWLNCIDLVHWTLE